MWDAHEDSDEAFERRIDAVCREIGDRGKLMVPEAVPPERTLAPASAPAVKDTTVTTSAPAVARGGN